MSKELLHLDSRMKEEEEGQGQSCRVLRHIHSEAHISVLWLCMFLFCGLSLGTQGRQ